MSLYSAINNTRNKPLHMNSLRKEHNFQLFYFLVVTFSVVFVRFYLRWWIIHFAFAQSISFISFYITVWFFVFYFFSFITISIINYQFQLNENFVSFYRCLVVVHSLALMRIGFIAPSISNKCRKKMEKEKRRKKTYDRITH